MEMVADKKTDVVQEAKMYPVAEIFVSPQGEGVHQGVLMTFIRFAGCNVGKPYTADAKATLGLNVYQERCTDWQGEAFACDTNYRMSKRYSVADLIAQVREGPKCVLLTGGEPLMHDLGDLIIGLFAAGKRVHIETSGTKQPPFMTALPPSRIWITVSPKQGYLPWVRDTTIVSEVKILVNGTFDRAIFERDFLPMTDNVPVWFSPVNDENDLRRGNMNLCLDMQRHYPSVRVMLQAHKIWKVR